MTYRVKNMIKGDSIIWTILLFLSLLSLLIVYSSTGRLVSGRDAGIFTFLIRHAAFLLVGFLIMVFMVNVIPVKAYSRISKLILLGSIALLVLAIALKLTGFTKGTGRTIGFGIFSFQPAEVAKLALVMYAAKMLGIGQGSVHDRIRAFWHIIIATAVVTALIAFSNVSTAILLFGTIISLLFVGRVPIRHLLMVIVAGIGMILLIYKFGDKMGAISHRFPTAQARMERFVNGDPASGRAITQADYAKLAIYEGGFLGKGPGNTDVANYMAAAYNDFIYAIIIEEYGLILGGASVLMLYLILFYRGITIVRKSNRTFPAFLVAGLTLMLVFQAMINMGVSAGIIPVTGQPLPWVSMGGTSNIFTAIAFGCILSVSYQNHKDNKTVETAVQVTLPDEDEELK